MNVNERLAQDRWSGGVELTIESREPDLVVAKMAVTDAARNAFGTVHAGALIWLADVAATICAVGDPGSVGENGEGFPLAIGLHTVLLGNERDGELTARSTTVQRGRRLVVVRTLVRSPTGRLLIDMTTTHLRAG
ncbi:MAG: PaaI family thioesterase [Gammaproteobacteria bacterium]|nr:PaaI family thioesterase [Gammaproteobacteria bacterium]MYK83779.1 PaaI family thioesterase [Gammaproteobacteria bacterium]